MKTKNTNLKILSSLIFVLILLLTTVVYAETDSGKSSAGAQASATGDVTSSSTKATVSSDSATAYALAKAKAENGGTATAIAEAWAHFVDKSSAYAYATATATAKIGESIWAEAYVKVTASSDGSSTAYSESYVGANEKNIEDGINNIIGNEIDNSVNGESYVKKGDPSFGGFDFGKSDIERYCHYKQQLTDNEKSNDEHAKYYLNIIAWDYGFNETKFEQKYNIICFE